jgi:hypothetical protein
MPTVKSEAKELKGFSVPAGAFPFSVAVAPASPKKIGGISSPCVYAHTAPTSGLVPSSSAPTVASTQELPESPIAAISQAPAEPTAVPRPDSEDGAPKEDASASASPTAAAAVAAAAVAQGEPAVDQSKPVDENSDKSDFDESLEDAVLTVYRRSLKDKSRKPADLETTLRTALERVPGSVRLIGESVRVAFLRGAASHSPGSKWSKSACLDVCSAARQLFSKAGCPSTKLGDLVAKSVTGVRLVVEKAAGESAHKKHSELLAEVCAMVVYALASAEAGVCAMSALQDSFEDVKKTTKQPEYRQALLALVVEDACGNAALALKSLSKVQTAVHLREAAQGEFLPGVSIGYDHLRRMRATQYRGLGLDLRAASEEAHITVYSHGCCRM